MKKATNYINHRLLINKIDKIDYYKLSKNKAYLKSSKSKLLFWYIYKDISMELAYYYLYKNHKTHINNYLKFFGLNDNNFKNNVEITVFFMKKYNSKECKSCRTIFVSNKGLFCSIKCSNNFSNKDINTKEKKAKSLKKYHSEMSKDEKNKNNEAISDGNKRFYKNENTEEKILRISKLKPYNSISWNNQVKYCLENDIEILFDENHYRNSIEMKYKCKKCSNIITKYKSTTFIRPVCEKCNPVNKRKAKTQYSIYKMILEHSKEVKYDDKTTIKPLELDINILSHNFAIEFDGLLPHSYGYSKISYYNNIEEDKNYHLNKTLLSENKGIQLYHIFENEWSDDNKRLIWESMINGNLGIHKKIYARKCTIKEVPTKEARKFIDENHMQGYINSLIKIGLFYESELIAIMTFGKPRYNNKYEYELIRFLSENSNQNLYYLMQIEDGVMEISMKKWDSNL